MRLTSCLIKSFISFSCIAFSSLWAFIGARGLKFLVFYAIAIRLILRSSLIQLFRDARIDLTHCKRIASPSVIASLPTGSIPRKTRHAIERDPQRCKRPPSIETSRATSILSGNEFTYRVKVGNLRPWVSLHSVRPLAAYSLTVGFCSIVWIESDCFTVNAMLFFSASPEPIIFFCAKYFLLYNPQN